MTVQRKVNPAILEAQKDDAKTPSPFLDATTYDDLREGTGYLLLFIWNLFPSLQLICCDVHMCLHVCAHVFVCVFSVNPPFPCELGLSYCSGTFPRLVQGDSHMLPAFYVLKVAFSLVAGITPLAALSLFLPSLLGSVFCWSCISPLILFYFFLLTDTRARPSSPLQDLLQTSRYRFTAARVLVIAQLLWVLINPAALGAS